MPPTAPDRSRYRRILRFAARELISIWWFDLVLPRLGLAGISARTRVARMRGFARRFHALAVDLGGLMIKVGQFMSSRLDVLPPVITEELEGLQDEVPPVVFGDIRALAEAELGAPLGEAYAAFEQRPLAAASLGQAHRARLHSRDADDVGFEDVVVKVQRPGIDAVVATDLAALRRVARWLSRLRIVSDRVDAPALVEEFATTSLEELDYLREAQSAERFAEAFSDDERVSAPEVVWELTSGRVLTLRDVTAIKINDTEALRAAGVDPADVARAFADVMLDQVFTHSFVHADPHPGNLFVTPRAKHPGGETPWHLTFIDFGMMTQVPDSLRAGLSSLVVAIADRDSRGLVAAAQRIGVLLPDANTGELERALSALFARFGGMGFAELRNVDEREFHRFSEEFGETMRSLPVQLPESLLLLIRAMSLTSGLGSNLDPTFNIWDPVEPYATRLLKEAPAGLAREAARQAAANASIVWRLPRRVDDLLTRVDQGVVAVDTSRLERRLDRLIRLGTRVLAAVLFAGFAIAGGIVLPEARALGVTLLAISALPLLYALVGGGPRR